MLAVMLVESDRLVNFYFLKSPGEFCLSKKDQSYCDTE